MATTLATVDITGLRVTHFRQLYRYTTLAKRKEGGYVVGRKDHWDERHRDLIEWIEGLIRQAEEEGVIIPSKQKFKKEGA